MFTSGRDGGVLAALAASVMLASAAVRGATPAAQGGGAVPKPAPPKTLRLYVFDCGMLDVTNEGVERYHVTPAEAGDNRMPVPCFLIAHPRGTLMWDVGVIPDVDVEAQGFRAKGVVNATVTATVTRTLKSQLAQIGYQPRDITYFAISHAHIDHTANLNQFAASTWLVRPAERDFMYAPDNPRVRPAFYTELKNVKQMPTAGDEFDVFGDTTVTIKAAPGHTPGHQVVVLKLASTGRVMLGGDLYHYAPERTFQRKPPDNEFNVAQSSASRAMIEDYLKRTGTTLWIEHDFAANAKLKKSPEFYE
jgi:glyoxylase-like metal-dependent hydrolase (beta-lactamase superfamily II)